MGQSLPKLKLLIMKERPLSFYSMMMFFLIFVGQLLFFYLPLYLSIRLTIPTGQAFSSPQWWAPILVAFFMVIMSYFWDYFRDRKKNKTIESDKIIYDCIGGAIQELHDINFQNPANKTHYINEILVYIEKVIISIFKATGLPCGTLCVNFMVKGDGHLELTKFATKFQDRDKLKIDFDPDNLLPGAPEAWILKKVIYIDDIESENYKPYFNADFKFKSFISIPIISNQNEVVGIINIDSNIKNQFVSEDFISKKIICKINPLILLFVFQNELFNNN